MNTELSTGRALAAILATCLLAGCSPGQPQQSTASNGSSQADALPQPEANGGSVTGFDGDAPPPHPTAPVPASSDDPDAPPSPIADADGGFDFTTPAAPGADVLTPPDDTGPGAADAAAVVRSYYDAINAGQYPRAHALWSDGGRASGQTGGQFAGGFSDTSRVNVSIGEPGRIEGAAGSRYVTIPVALEAVHADGSIRHFAGSYTLRRAAVDGASAEQREWRISDADLRQVE